jgi:hypothetical protein
MTADKEIINFKVDGNNFGKFKLQETDKKMRLYIKLNKDEADQWKALKTALTGDTMNDDLLARILFFKGIHSITQELNERVENMTEEERETILSQVSEDQIAAASKIAQQELDAEDDETSDTANN